MIINLCPNFGICLLKSSTRSKNFHSKWIHSFWLLLFVITITSCSVSKKQASMLMLKDSYCAPPTYFLKFTHLPVPAANDILAANEGLDKAFSKQNVLILYALALNKEMKELLQLKGDTTIKGKMRKMEIGNKLNRTLLLAMSDINAAAAELDCEGERVDQVAGYIDNINTSKNNKLVAGSIVLGAATSMAGAFITGDNANKAVAIGGGLLGGGLGLLTLNPKGKKIEFYHQRNLLRDVWQQSDTESHFSPFIWYMLNEKSFSNSGQSSLLQNLKNRWIAYQFDGAEKQGNQSVVFTDGGVYLSGDLHARATMINQLQAVIRSINQHINNLMLESNQVIE